MRVAVAPSLPNLDGASPIQAIKNTLAIRKVPRNGTPGRNWPQKWKTTRGKTHFRQVDLAIRADDRS